MIAQLQQVAWTYIRRPVSSLLSAIFVALVFPGVLLVLFSPLDNWWVFSWLIPYAPMLIANHLMQQAIHARERRMPGAVGPHITVWLGLFALLCLAPVIRVTWTGQGHWGLPGLILAINALAVWLTLVPTIWRVFGPTLLLAVFLGRGSQEWVTELMQGRHESVGLALCAGSLTAIAAALVYLVSMTEESGGYRLVSYMWQMGKPIEGKPEVMAEAWKGSILARWSLRLHDPAVGAAQRWVAWSKGSIWQRARLWGVARGPLMPVLAGLVFMIATMAIIYARMLPAPAPHFAPHSPAWPVGEEDYQRLVAKLESSLPPPRNSSPFPMIMALMVMMPATLGIVTSVRWPMLAVESLRPVSRRNYFHELGMALIWRQALAWLTLVGLGIVVISFWGPPTEMPLPILPGLFGLTLAAQVMMFGNYLWLFRIRSRAVHFALIMPGVMGEIFGGIGLIALFGGTKAPMAWWLTALVVLLAGLLISYEAYRRWLRTELG